MFRATVIWLSSGYCLLLAGLDFHSPDFPTYMVGGWVLAALAFIMMEIVDE